MNEEKELIEQENKLESFMKKQIINIFTTNTKNYT